MSCSRTFRVWTVLVGVALAAACGGGDSDSPTALPTVPDPSVMQPVVSVEVSSPAEPTALGEPLQLGETLQLSVEALDENGQAVAGVEFSWESSNTSVATVDATGLVTGVAEGTATITASAGDVQATVEITVVSAMQPVVSVEVSPSAETITLGGTLQLSAAAFDENGQAVSGAEFSWESSNASVATVDATGLVTGVAEGTATITASAGDVQGRAHIAVANPAANQAPEAVGTIPPRTMTAGQSATLDLSPFFSDPDGDALTYTAESSDGGVVTATVSGSTLTVTAVAAGTATLTVTAADPDGLMATQSANVTVERDGGGGGGAFRDDFTSSASLSDWEILNADAVVSGGLLRLTSYYGDGRAFRELDKPITSTSWTIRARLGRATTAGRVAVLWDTGLDRRTQFRFEIGDNGDGDSYYLWVWDEESFAGPGWYNVISDDPGKSDAIHDGPNELTTIAFGWQGEFFVAVAGDTELFRARPNQDFISSTGGDYSVTLGQITGISLVREDYRGAASAGLFDWVEVIGGGSSAAPADVSGETSPQRR